MFAPIGIILGLAGGQVAKKIFDQVWGLFDDIDAPEPKIRNIDGKKLILSLLVQGAIFRLVRGGIDHFARHGWEKLTGSWPGELDPEPDN